MPQTLAGRFVPAVAIALFVSLGIGAALAASDGETGATEVTSIHIPEARFGDRASYDLTLDGEWLYDDKVAGQPFHFFAFDWRAGDSILDRQGRERQTDVVRIEGLAYSPFNREFTEDGDLVQGSTWAPDNETAWFEPATTILLAKGGRQIVNSTQPATNLPLPPNLATRTSGDNSTYVGYWSSDSSVCLAGESWQGTEVIIDQPLRVGPCVLQQLSHHRATYGPLQPKGREELGTLEAYRFEGKNAYGGVVSIWLADGIPFPIRYQSTEPTTLGIGERGNGTFTLDLTGYSAGSQDRVPRGPPGLAPPALATAPYHTWGLDETGIVHPFPVSEAYRIATEESSMVKALLAESPEAYVAYSSYTDSSYNNDAYRSWLLTVTNGSTHVMVRVLQTGGPAESITGPFFWDRLPQVPEQAMVYEYQTEDIYQHESDYIHPHRDQLPKEWPTVQAAATRWAWYAQLPDDPDFNSWGHRVRCWSSCDKVVIDITAGRRYSDTSIVAMTPDLSPRVLGRDWLHSALGFDATGNASWFTQSTSDYHGARVVAPTSPPVASATDGGGQPSNLLATLVPTVPQAAGATLLGLILGALYWLWPKLKVATGVGLFSRIAGRDLLDHPARASLMQVVQAEPGIHFQDLVRRSGLPNGTAVHHLGKLSKGGLVSVRALGRYTCYFPGSTPTASALAAAPVLRSEGARRVYEAIQGRPGLSGVELADLVALQPSTVNYHVQRLVDSGLVVAARDGRAVRLSPAAAS